MIGMTIERIIIILKRIRNKLYTVMIAPCFYSTGVRISVTPPFRFANLSQVELGNRVTIHGNCWIQVMRCEADSPISTPRAAPKLILANNVGIGMDSTISVAKKIVIGENVMTARNVYISDHSHEFRDPTIPMANQGICNVAEVVIGANTWLGQNAIVLPGVTIGKHCVIGANSVVKYNIPDYSVAVGAPAKVVRRYNSATELWERVSSQ